MSSPACNKCMLSDLGKLSPFLQKNAKIKDKHCTRKKMKAFQSRTKENGFVRIQRVNDDIHQTINLSLEFMLLGSRLKQQDLKQIQNENEKNENKIINTVLKMNGNNQK